MELPKVRLGVELELFTVWDCSEDSNAKCSVVQNTWELSLCCALTAYACKNCGSDFEASCTNVGRMSKPLGFKYRWIPVDIMARCIDLLFCSFCLLRTNLTCQESCTSVVWTVFLRQFLLILKPLYKKAVWPVIATEWVYWCKEKFFKIEACLKIVKE